MSDYIFIRRSRNLLSTVIHAVLNLMLAIASILATVITGNFGIGLILVFISKWRVFAVNHRYWLLNLRANLVDFIVGTSFVLLAYAAGTSDLQPVHYVLMAGYAIWLIAIKPRSSAFFTTIQAIFATLLGATAAAILTANFDAAILVLSCFLIGFAAIHHIVIQNNDEDYLFISSIGGLVYAEIAWMAHSWLIIYTINDTGICLSQLGIILSVLTFAFYKIYSYASEHRHKIRFTEVALPIIFSVAVIAVLVIGFSQPRFNIY